jgi:hypothetical protein
VNGAISDILEWRDAVAAMSLQEKVDYQLDQMNGRPSGKKVAPHDRANIDWFFANYYKLTGVQKRLFQGIMRDSSGALTPYQQEQLNGLPSEFVGPPAPPAWIQQWMSDTEARNGYIDYINKKLSQNSPCLD